MSKRHETTIVDNNIHCQMVFNKSLLLRHKKSGNFLRKDFYIFHLLLFLVFLCVLDIIYLPFLYISFL